MRSFNIFCYFQTALLQRQGLPFLFTSPLQGFVKEPVSSPQNQQHVRILIFKGAKILQGVSCPLFSADREVDCKTITIITHLSMISAVIV